MGLDISVWRITKNPEGKNVLGERDYFQLTDGHGQYEPDAALLPRWTKSMESIIDLTMYNWDKYRELTGLDVENMYMCTWAFDEEKDSEYMVVEDDAGEKHTIWLKDVPLTTVPTKVLYRTEIGYQRKGLNAKFYQDYTDDKYYVCTLAELERYKKEYAEDPDEFQENIIDPFVEGQCIVTFSW